MHLAYPAVLAALLFCVGLYGVLARRNAILVLMSVELMLNAVNLNLVAFDVWLRDALHGGQALTLFTITIAAAEIGLGLAIVLMVFRTQGTADIDRLRALSDQPGSPGAEGGDTGLDGSGSDSSGPDGGAGTAPGADSPSGPSRPASADSQGKATVA
ncbi:NADH-quinone oxidoreductase subunit NuoK [Streptacidiphilus sp. EB129]|uniref:NADH-quinone oxidoreductase subunit NuoK n=1 Tax=Streptacidiphilus sp. EB129 TaxID=3156262 RepID=UPI0035139966